MEKDKAGLLKYVGFIALMAIIDPCAFVFVFAAYDNIGASVASIIMILIAWVHIIVPGVITAIVMLKSKNKYLNDFLNNFLLHTIILIVLFIIATYGFDLNLPTFFVWIATYLSSLLICYCGIYFVIVVNKMAGLIKRMIRRRG